MLEPGWRTVDWYVLVGLVGCQLLLSIGLVLPDVLREYVPLPLANIFVADGVLDPGQAWLLLGVLGLAVVMRLWGNRPHEAVMNLVFLGLSLPLLTAQPFRAERAVASALRWSLALGFLACSALLWLRRPLGRRCAALGIGWPTKEDIPSWIRSVLLVGTVVPVLLLTLWIAILGFSGHQPAGPNANTVFTAIGWTASTVIPLLFLALGLLGHGLFEDSAGYVAGAGYLLVATLVGGHALAVVIGGGAINGSTSALLLQLGILGVAVWGLAWLASKQWRDLTLLGWQVGLGCLGCLGLCLGALPSLLSRPVAPLPKELHEFLLQAGNWPGWMGLFGLMVLSLWYARLLAPRSVSVHLLGLIGFLLGIVTACTAVWWDSDGWLAYHTLTLMWALAGLGLLLAGWAGDSLPRVGPVFWSAERRTRAAVLLRQLLPAGPTRCWVEGFGLVVVLLALTGSLIDPGRFFSSCTATLAISVLLAADAVWSRRPLLVYLSGLLVNVAGFLYWRSGSVGPLSELDPLTRFVYLQVICLAIASACWSLLELRLRLLNNPIDLRHEGMPFVHAAVLAALHLLAVVVLTGLVSDLTRCEIHLAGPLAWAALSATLAAVVLCFWDPEATDWGLPVGAAYVVGLLFLGLVLHQLSLPPRELLRTATLSLASYLAATTASTWLASRGAWLLRRLRLPTWTDTATTPWFLLQQALLGFCLLGMSLWICLDFPFLGQRLFGPAAAALLTLAVIIWTTEHTERHGKRSATLPWPWAS